MTGRSPDWIARQVATQASYIGYLRDLARRACEPEDPGAPLAALHFKGRRAPDETRPDDDLLDIPRFLRRA